MNGVVDQRRDAVHHHDGQQERESQDVERPGERDQPQQHGPGEVGSDHQRPATGPVDQGPDDQTENQVRQPSRRAEPPDLDRTAPQRHHHQGLQRQ
jgi:hypothetical protein